MQYAQCGLLDHAVMNSVPDADNHVWRRAPLEEAYLGTLPAGNRIPEVLRKLLGHADSDNAVEGYRLSQQVLWNNDLMKMGNKGKVE
ncbi:hypothetical protein [Klebsiella aerogenes]|uniref:hypothetical protein n=1 Tax=Klebsiella aerogenes TaxID=548 RepID=UPI00351CEA81